MSGANRDCLSRRIRTVAQTEVMSSANRHWRFRGLQGVAQTKRVMFGRCFKINTLNAAYQQLECYRSDCCLCSRYASNA